MNVNPGLSSRFPNVINFRNLSPENCLGLLVGELQRQKRVLAERNKVLDIACLERPPAEFRETMLRAFQEMAAQKNWANARDVQSLVKTLWQSLLKDFNRSPGTSLVVRESTVIEHVNAMLSERRHRNEHQGDIASTIREALGQLTHAPASQQNVRTISTTTTSASAIAATEPTTAPDEAQETQTADPVPQVRPMDDHSSIRDAGVSDVVWNQLQHDRLAEQQREEEYQALRGAKEEARDAAHEALVRKLLEEREREAKSKEKLAKSGRCPVGYQWIKQTGGYRCAGGSHWILDGELAKL
jgi:hypothetical protein